MTDLQLFNSLTRSLETFEPVHPGEARVYSCGPTVYNYQHIGNMRAYVFADTLGRVLQWKGYKLTHVINITDVGHLTSDADEGEDKMERMAARENKSAWEIAKFYQQDFERDLARLNVQTKQHPRATEYVEAMIAWGQRIAEKHCYELDSGLYFDVSTVEDYGRLARAVTDDGEGRIDTVEGKRNAADFAIWRKTPAGETRQMEWDSPWGRGAPGWHLECSVMGEALLGFPFDIHTGGIDHREIHHPNEIAQNQAYCCTNGLDDARNSGAKIWMHNNFLVERSGKMSKSAGEFLRLQLLVDKGYHPLAYRLMCLQAHYRSELEFSWEGLEAALTRLKRMVMAVETLKSRHAEPVSASMEPSEISLQTEGWTLKQVQGDEWGSLLGAFHQQFHDGISSDLNTSIGLNALEAVLGARKADVGKKLEAIAAMDAVLGLDLLSVSRADLRIRPASAAIEESEIEDALARRKAARAEKDFAASDAIRDELAAKGVEVMDGDQLGWEWKLA
ncbi:cysteine--tRNA ligase [Alteriqipengyuania flavescens]|uniref:cysteine--tRNA ligase n=1 Tax=Alteriqipengyuania flavescens TaxID=3053610 RepID=UPI0025B3B16B|nr:cysteine--tRNA ligase [Alteriqipengyuania flavescens]WJY18716.1 cysteine--tRNA ligase [Alteriqipengyuania flavescens]WJY24656.1 cysteine--tRNA ligase [Alteriqipengyuania flavescens]